MSKYHVFVNCAAFRRIVVEADNEEQAEQLARQHFLCDSTEGDADHHETRIATQEDLDTAEDYS